MDAPYLTQPIPADVLSSASGRWTPYRSISVALLPPLELSCLLVAIQYFCTTEAIQIKGYQQQVYRLLPHEYSCRPITSLLLACGCSMACMNIHELIWTITLCLCTLCGSHIAVQLPMVCMASVVHYIILALDSLVIIDLGLHPRSLNH